MNSHATIIDCTCRPWVALSCPGSATPMVRRRPRRESGTEPFVLPPRLELLHGRGHNGFTDPHRACVLDATLRPHPGSRGCGEPDAAFLGHRHGYRTTEHVSTSGLL